MQILDLWKYAFVFSVIFFFLTVLSVFLCTIATKRKHTIIGAVLYLLAHPFMLIAKCSFAIGLVTFIFKLIFLLNCAGIALW